MGTLPFTGGQCAGILYNVVGTGTRASGTTGNPFTASAAVRGAVRGAKFVNGVGNVTSLVFLGEVNAGAPLGEYGAGVVPTNFGTPATDVTSFKVASVTRADAQPDNCGNPGGTSPPYTPGGNTYNDNVTYNDNSGNTVTIPVALVFGYATVNVNGQVIIPINANFNANPTFNTNLNFNLNTGGITPDFSNPNDSLPSPCSDPGGFNPAPDIPLPPPSIPDAAPVPPPSLGHPQRQKLLKGCIVTTTFIDGNESVIFQKDNPDIYVPSLGYVQFQIQVGGSSAWTNDIPVKSLRTFIQCPWDAGAIDVKGTPRFGNLFQVTPVYVTRTFNPTYPPDS